MEFKLVKFKDWLILLFSREGGDLLQHIFNAPPENLDGVDRVYLEGKLKCKLSMKEVKFIQKEYKKQYKELFKTELFLVKVKKLKEAQKENLLNEVNK